MPMRSRPLVITYRAHDATGAGITADGPNHSLVLVRDGVPATPAAVPTEIGPAVPGLYNLAVSGTEADCDLLTLAGVSSTPGVTIEPVFLALEAYYLSERGTLSAEFDQGVQVIYVVGFIGAAGDYAGQLCYFVTGPTRKRTITQHTVVLAPDGLTPVHKLTFNIPLGAAPIGGVDQVYVT
jgi:hypothetical protein